MGHEAGSDLCFRVSSRDRIAPNCPIRQSVWQVVALQRRVRFSAWLAGFFRIRCHQRRARRAERASFSVFVSNLDFRGTRLRQIEERALRQRRRGHSRGPESRPVLPRCSCPSTFWSRCGPSLLDVHLSSGPTALDPVANTDTKLLIYGLFKRAEFWHRTGCGATSTAPAAAP